ncbi:MAG: hypothetical protein NT135_02130 [Candidatus Berkelbacteria bacterium]|nr:hypothetical protein [Candidatus Berkelbacteria bacterium]
MEKSFSFQKILNNYLRQETEKRKEKKVEYFHASQLGSCKRKQIWRRMNEKETNPADDRALRIFAVGDIFHEFLQKKAEESGCLIAKEQEVINDEYNYKGRYDAFIEKDGVKLLYDFKSQHSQSFHYMQENGTGVDEGKKLQIVSYAVMGNLPVQECRLLFVSKDDLCMMEVPVKVEDYKDKVVAELKELNQFYKTKIIPEPLPEIENGRCQWQCLYCPFRDKCRGEGWEEEVKNKIKEQKKNDKNNIRKNIKPR